MRSHNDAMIEINDAVDKEDRECSTLLGLFNLRPLPQPRNSLLHAKTDQNQMQKQLMTDCMRLVIEIRLPVWLREALCTNFYEIGG